MPDRVSLALLRPVTGRVAILGETPGFAVVTPAGGEFAPARSWLLQLESEGYPPTTRRSYANSLARYLHYVWGAGLSWRADVETTLGSFATFAATDRRGGRTYSKSTVKHTANVVRKFYDYADDADDNDDNDDSTLAADVVAPVVGRQERRRPTAGSAAIRRPRTMPRPEVQRYFWTLGSNRDRALVSLWACTPIRATELLALTPELVNFGDRSVCALRAGAVQLLPVPRSALVWMSLYLAERGTPSPGECMWLKMRAAESPQRSLSLAALRMVISHAKELLAPDYDFGDLKQTLLTEQHVENLVDLRSLTQTLSAGRMMYRG